MGRLRTPPVVSLSLLLLAARFLPPQLPSFVAPRARQQPTATAAGTAVLSGTLQLPGEAHAVPEQRILDFFNVTLDKGLSEHQVQQQLDEYGANQLLEPEKKSLWELVAEQFDDLLVQILLLSALVSFLLAYFNTDQKEGLSAYIEPLVILMILVLNACVGVWQESNAEKALDSLKKLQSDTATVLRGGRWGQIDAVNVVPGDVCEVKAGDKVPADIRLVKLKTTTVRAEQSQLTGETQSVIKDPEIVDDPSMVLQGKNNMLFASTTISNGACVGCVVATGMSTEIGAIQGAVTEAEKDPTPLQKKLDEFGNTLARIIFAICVIVWLINYKHFFDPVHGSFLQGCIYYFKIAVALAVAAIPEGLPAVVTTCLALGTQQMAERNAIVRKLPSVETLGCTTVICSDKTGTLTLNEMCCTQMVLPQSPSEMKSFKVEGNGYSPVGHVNGLSIDWSSNKALRFFCKVATLCNDSRLTMESSESSTITRTGEPTEAALRVLVEKLGCPAEELVKANLEKPRDRNSIMAFNDYWGADVKKQATLEFARDRKSMSVLCTDGEVQAENVLYIKGAPESILDRCSSIMLPDGTLAPLTEDSKKLILGKMLEMAGEALRTLALAVKFDLKESKLNDYDGPGHPSHGLLCDPSNFASVEQGMAFLGMVGIIDPPRPECMDAIAACKEAGISVFMTTGDNKATAEAISRQLGILSPDSEVAVKSITGKEFEEMSESQRAEVLKRMMADRGSEGAVFSRMEPKHKQIVVKMLKDQDEIVAMTGDGVNDAPALKQADIGVAMGMGGTEVAKEASDMVLANDNFSSIVAAVEQGRSIFKNMKAVIRYLISSNIGEVASIFLTAALGIPESLAPVQLLWVNLVTDGLPATALGFNPPDEGVMSEPPRRKDEGLISGWALFRYLMIGLYVGLATVGVFIYWFTTDEFDGHTLVSLDQLMNWGQCSAWGGFSAEPIMGMDFSADACSYFTVGKVKAATLAITVLVMIQLLNAFNAVSEDGSLLSRPPWLNPYLVTACAISAILHCIILYTPLAGIFGVCPLDGHDWVLVAAFSLPVLLLDELLKYISRQRSSSGQFEA